VVYKEGEFLPGVLQIRIDDSSLELQAKLDEKYGWLVKDRQELHMFIFPCTDGLTTLYAHQPLLDYPECGTDIPY